MGKEETEGPVPPFIVITANREVKIDEEQEREIEAKGPIHPIIFPFYLSHPLVIKRQEIDQRETGKGIDRWVSDGERRLGRKGINSLSLTHPFPLPLSLSLHSCLLPSPSFVSDKDATEGRARFTHTHAKPFNFWAWKRTEVSGHSIPSVTALP